MIYLYAQDKLSHSQLIKTLKRLRRHLKLGFYVDVEQHSTNQDDYTVKLYGPAIYWKRKSVWEIACRQN